MSIPLTINGAVFEYPQNFDEDWGVDATGWAQAVTAGALYLSGGNFPLTANVNFGASFGLLSAYFSTRAANPAGAGTVRLASGDAGIAFRNNANSGNLVITTDSSDNLLYNGHIITPSVAGTVTSITGTTSQVIASASTGNITLSLPQSIASSSSPTFAALTLGTPLPVGDGGIGVASLTAYAVLCGGTTSTGVVQSIAAVGSSGQVLTSNGPGALPSFSNTTGSGTVNSGTGGQLAIYATSGSIISGSSLLTTSTGTGAGLTATADEATIHAASSTSNPSRFILSDSAVTSWDYQLNGDATSFRLRDQLNTQDVLTYTHSTNVITLTAPLSFASTNLNGVVGTTTNDSAAAGNTGEYIESVVSGTPLSIGSGNNNVFIDFTSITLSAGDWDVSFNANFYNINGNTWSQCTNGISTTSGNHNTGLLLGSNELQAAFASSSTTPVLVPMTVANYRMSLSTSTAVYAKVSISYSAFVNNFFVYGRLSARRVR